MAGETHNDRAWLFRLTDAQRLEPFRCERLLKWWDEVRQLGAANGRGERAVTAGFLLMASAAGLELSRATLFNWRRAYRADGLRGLADQRVPAARASADGDYAAFLAEFEARYLGGGLLPAATCFQLARERAEREGWPVPTLRHARRYLKAHILPGLTRERGSGGGD